MSAIADEIRRIISEKESELRACNLKMADYKKKLNEEAENFRIIELSISNLKTELNKFKDNNVTVF